MNKYGSLAAFGLAFFLLIVPNVFALELTLYPIYDSYVAENAKPNNFGNITYADINSGTSTNHRAFFLFNYSDIPAGATINSAYLNLTKNAGVPNRTYGAYNTSPSWNETNITWNSQPTKDVWQYNVTDTQLGGVKKWVITDAVVSAFSQSKHISIVIKDMVENQTSAGNNRYYTKEAASNLWPALVLDLTLANNCSTVRLGSYCDMASLDETGRPTMVITTPDYTCNNDLSYVCPTGLYCTQITPQVNITTPLVENFTDCSKCTYTYTTALGFFPIKLWTNCPNNPECEPVLGNQSNVFTSSCLWGPANPLIVTCPSTFTTPTSDIPASANYYTAGCYNPSLGWVPIVIDQNGNTTSIYNLTVSIFGNNTTLATPHREDCPANTTSLCYNDACQQVTCQSSIAAVSCSSASGYTDQLVCAMGGLLGVSDIGNSKFIASIIFSFIIAIAVLAALNYYGVGGESMGMVFVMSLLMLTIMFTFIGWFPAWIMIILMVLGALMVAKMLKVV